MSDHAPRSYMYYQRVHHDLDFFLDLFTKEFFIDGW